jgi:glycosyltransferase involved in cell wall biosynthesis
MKVLYLIETLGLGGAEKSLLQLLPNMRGIEPLVCHLYQGQDLKPDFEAAGIRVISVNLPPKYHFPTAIRKLRQIVDQEKPDLVHTMLFRAEIVGRIVAKQKKIPVVCSIVSECYADVRWKSLSTIGKSKLKGIQLLDRFTAGSASHFIANSAAVKESESRSLRIPKERVSVIHRSRSPEQYNVILSDDQKHRYRSDLEISPDAIVILNVARLVDSKGHPELVDAFKTVALSNQQATLLLVGDGPDRKNLETKIKAAKLCDRVRLLGQRTDIPELLALTDIFAFPSHYEGHPGALVEAMLSQTSCVVSDTPVHRETIENELTGLVVSLKCPGELADAILRLVEDSKLRARLAICAKQDAIRRFNIRNTPLQYSDLYQKVIGASKKGHKHYTIPQA